VNQLKQLALAVHMHHDAKKVVPVSARPVGLTTAPRIAAMTHLLFYLEEANVRNTFDLAKNWGHIDNRRAVNTPIATLNCPSTPENSDRLDGLPEVSPWVADVSVPTDYSPTVWVDQLLVASSQVDQSAPAANLPGIMEYNNVKASFKRVTDGLSKTILLAESAGRPFLYRAGGQKIGGDLTQARVNGGGWCRPASDIVVFGLTSEGISQTGECALNCANGLDIVASSYPHPTLATFGTSSPYAFHPGVVNHAFGDGSVRPVNDSVGIREYSRLVTRAGGEIAAVE
jgi:hypothetical protein